MPKITEHDVRAHRRMRSEEILDTAERLLADPGAEPITVAHIADRIGLTRTAVYKYYESMDGVLEAVVARHFPAWRSYVAEAIERHATPADRIVAYVRANIEQATISDHAWRVGLSRVGLGTEARERIAAEHRDLARLLIDEVAVLTADDAARSTNLAMAIQALTDTAVNRIDAGADPDETSDFFCEMARRLIE